MASPRKILRRAFEILTACVFIPVVGEFFINIAKEAHIYEHPSERVERGMNYIIAMASDPNYRLVVTLIVGILIGMSVDFIFKRREANPTGQTDIISLGNLCCYLAYKSKWAQGQIAHSPAFSVKVSNEIRDMLFQGKLIASGRPFSPDSPRHLLMTRPSRKIDPSWWEAKFIDAWRPMNSAGFENVIYENSQQRSGYHDLTFERASVEAVWPPAD